MCLALGFGLPCLPTNTFGLSDSILCMSDHKVTDEIEALMRRAASHGSSGALARREGDEAAAESHFREAHGLAAQAAEQAAGGEADLSRQNILHKAVIFALEAGKADEARRLMEDARSADKFNRHEENWAQVLDVNAWEDAWLIAAVRRDPPDVAALDVLADRHWKPLFGRCQILTSNPEKAGDLAQQAWCRVLRARHTLKPGGNLPALLATIATNLWRDSNRSARRAGPLAEHRMKSLDAAFATEDGESGMLAEILPDLNALQAEEQKLLAMDIDRALEQLTPLLRDVLVSRMLAGESCAEIGRRYDRTEQTVSAWVRQAVREMKQYFEKSGFATKADTQ